MLVHTLNRLAWESKIFSENNLDLERLETKAHDLRKEMERSILDLKKVKFSVGLMKELLAESEVEKAENGKIVRRSKK